MSIEDKFSRLRYAEDLIHRKATGTPEQFAHKLNISESSLYELLSLMKSFGCPIAYNKFPDTYYYEEEGRLGGLVFIRSQPDGNSGGG